MRSVLNALLVVLLIAAFAVGAAIPAKASCQGTSDCALVKAGLVDGPCEQTGEPCKVAQNCAPFLQKMSAASAVRVALSASQAHYGRPSNDVMASASVLPETAPPRI